MLGWLFTKKHTCQACGTEMIEMFNEWFCEECDRRQKLEDREKYVTQHGNIPPSRNITTDYSTLCSGIFVPDDTPNNYPVS